MRGIKYGLLFMICMLIMPNISHAACDYQRLAELSRIAGNVQISYDYDDTKLGDFQLSITNLTKDVYLIDNYGDRIDGSNEITLIYGNGEKIEFDIYSNDINCLGVELLTKYINLPYYNRFSADEVCQNSSFKLCSMWADTSDMSLVQFREAVKNSGETVQTESVIVRKVGIFDLIVSFLKKNYYIFILVIILVVSVIVYKKIRSRQVR